MPRVVSDRFSLKPTFGYPHAMLFVLPEPIGGQGLGKWLVR